MNMDTDLGIFEVVESWDGPKLWKSLVYRIKKSSFCALHLFLKFVLEIPQLKSYFQSNRPGRILDAEMGNRWVIDGVHLLCNPLDN